MDLPPPWASHTSDRTTESQDEISTLVKEKCNEEPFVRFPPTFSLPLTPSQPNINTLCEAATNADMKVLRLPMNLHPSDTPPIDQGVMRELAKGQGDFRGAALHHLCTHTISLPHTHHKRITPPSLAQTQSFSVTQL
jgi:hypothetical protein